MAHCGYKDILKLWLLTAFHELDPDCFTVRLLSMGLKLIPNLKTDVVKATLQFFDEFEKNLHKKMFFFFNPGKCKKEKYNPTFKTKSD